jgi:hypothetical protein
MKYTISIVTVISLSLLFLLSGCTTTKKPYVQIGKLKCECANNPTLIKNTDGGYYCDCE